MLECPQIVAVKLEEYNCIKCLCVICLAGDGGLQFTLAELGSAMELGIPLIVLLLNNHSYGEIKSSMQAASVEPVGVDLFTPDFVSIAQAYGWHAEVASDEAAVVQAVLAASRRHGPTLIELPAGL